MRLFLHIGTEKTGTTSLQAFLNINRDALAANGLFVPRTVGIGNHRWLPVLAYREDRVDEFTIDNQWSDPAKRKRDTAAKLAEFKAELSSVTQPDVVMTSEHLHSRLTTPGEVMTLKSILAPHFDEIRVIAYLRDPFAMAVSLYSTALRAGGTQDDVFAPDSTYMQHAADYRRLLRMWVDAFGAEAIEPRLYDRNNLVGGDVISDFCALLGVGELDLPLPDTKNKSLGALALKVLKVFNKITQNRGLNRAEAQRRRDILIVLLEKHFDALPKFKGDERTRAAYEKAFCEPTEWVRQTYFPQFETLFRTTEVRPQSGPQLSNEEVWAIARAFYEMLEHPAA